MSNIPAPVEPARNSMQEIAEFIEARRPQLLAFIERQMSDALRRKVEPQDVLQEVAVHAVKSAGEFDRAAGDLFAWLCQVCERRIIDAHRRYFGAQKRSAAREQSLNAPLGDDSRGEQLDLLAASMTTASEAFSKRQKEFALRNALGQMPPEAQEVLRLRYVDNLATKEIAQRIGKTDGAVRVMLTRCVAKLQKLLGVDDEKPAADAE